MKETNFEEAYSQLEEIVQKLETGNISLEEATNLFVEGVKLAKTCHKYLAKTDLKITNLKKSLSEQLESLDQGDTLNAQD